MINIVAGVLTATHAGGTKVNRFFASDGEQLEAVAPVDVGMQRHSLLEAGE